MANFFEDKHRNVIPNFRSLKKTFLHGELENGDLKKIAFKKDDIGSLIDDFHSNNSLAHAGDLVSSAVVNNFLELPEIIEAAVFIIENRKESTYAQIKIANKILGIKKEHQSSVINGIDDFLEQHTKTTIWARIKELKKIKDEGNYNPFVYVELARLYSIIAEKVKAYKNIYIAYNLAANNRYVLRSFARLISHFGDIEQAHDVLRKSNLINQDPWILASEIGLASLRGRSSIFVKKGLEIISSENYTPFSLSELASSIATLELNNGSRKKSKKLFEKSLVNPNDNSLAQAEWANHKEKFLEININNYEKGNNYEAFALDASHKSDWV
jgi:hypothetical protein